MSAEPALAIVAESEVEHGDGDSGGPHDACREALTGFLVLLTARVEARSPLLSRMMQVEIEALLETFQPTGESTDGKK